MVNTVVIPFFDIEVSVNTLLGIALFLIIFFTFFSVSFEMHIGEGDDTNVACNRRKPGETDGDGVNRWYGLLFLASHPRMHAVPQSDSHYWMGIVWSEGRRAMK